MNSNKALIDTFYTAFKNKDYQAMADCYHPDAHFQDEVFELKGKAIGAMWHMLCERGTDMTMSYSVKEEAGKVTAHWEPIYSFSKTGRRVHNIIDAEFAFKDGKIIKHRDRFNFWRWTRKALGLPGLLLGWTPLIRGKVCGEANKALNAFIKKHPTYL
jgi:ketosteroid isomerase-like protein